MNRRHFAWVTAFVTVVGIALGAARMVIRVNDVERKANKVEALEMNVRVMGIYMQIKDSTTYNLAVKLAK